MRRIHWLPRGTTTPCGVFAGFEGVEVSDHWGNVTCLRCRNPTPKAMAELHCQALIEDAHRSLPRECPDGSGRVAPADHHWARNLLSGAWVLEENGLPYTLSVTSETYWSS